MNLRRAAVTVGIAAVTALGPSVHAAAHSDDGVIEIVTAEPAGPLAVNYDIALTYTNDGDPADGATVTLAADGPAGAIIGPVPLQPTDQLGHYTTTVTYPTAGAWAIRLSALSPTASLARNDTITDAQPATTPPLVPTTGSPPTTSIATRTAPNTSPASALLPDDTERSSIPSTTTADTASDDSSSAAPWIAAGVALAAIGGVVAVVVIRRRSRTE